MMSPCYCCLGQIVVVNIISTIMVLVTIYISISLHTTSGPLLPWLSLLFPLFLIATGDTLLLRVNTVKVVVLQLVVHTGQIWSGDTKYMSK